MGGNVSNQIQGHSMSLKTTVRVEIVTFGPNVPRGILTVCRHIKHIKPFNKRLYKMTP